MNQQLKELDKVLSTIDSDFDWVNWGGCGVVAALLSQALRHIFPIMRITASGCHYRGSASVNIDKIRESLNGHMTASEWYEAGFSFAHIWVEIQVNRRWYAIDSEGVRPVKDMYETWSEPAKGSFTHDEVQRLADDTSNWNTMFKRKQIPDMRRHVELILEDFR